VYGRQAITASTPTRKASGDVYGSNAGNRNYTEQGGSHRAKQEGLPRDHSKNKYKHQEPGKTSITPSIRIPGLNWSGAFGIPTGFKLCRTQKHPIRPDGWKLELNRDRNRNLPPVDPMPAPGKGKKKRKVTFDFPGIKTTIPMLQDLSHSKPQVRSSDAVPVQSIGS
jgi:hypothetical protein